MEVDPTFATYLFFIKLYPKSTLTFFPVRPSSVTLKDGASRGLHREKPTLACVLVVGRRYAAGTKLCNFRCSEHQKVPSHSHHRPHAGWLGLQLSLPLEGQAERAVMCYGPPGPSPVIQCSGPGGTCHFCSQLLGQGQTWGRAQGRGKYWPKAPVAFTPCCRELIVSNTHHT